MVTVIAQLSDVHVGGPNAGSGERLSAAVDEINRMTRQPDLVLLTGDVTHSASAAEWAECKDRLAALTAPWTAIPGNHDRGIVELAGHRTLDVGPLRLVLLDTSSDEFTAEDETWLDDSLAAEPDRPTIVAVHQPPFETGIWWMDCIGLRGAERLEEVVRRHGQVVKVLSGHVHRAIQSNWGACSLWVGPSTSVTIAVDLDPAHQPAQSAEPAMFSLHAYTATGVVSHVVPIGAEAHRSLLGADEPQFVEWVRGLQARRHSDFS